jgi:hypothetical protein
MSVLPVGMAGASGSYSITNSVRMDGSAAYLSRTPSSASGNSQFWISTWVKLGKVNVQQEICSAYGGGTGLFIRLLSTGELQIQNYAGTVYRKSTRLFRDPGAWGHLFLSFNGSTSLDGWWNGEALTWATSGSLPASYDWHNNVVHRIACQAHAVSDLWTGYYSDFISVSGSTGTPSLTGKTDSNGVWVPIKYAGTYGTNGVLLAFGSSGALGTDTSGNGNTWTVNGSPVQTTDTPTCNYATLNPLDWAAGTATLSNGNLTFTGSSGDNLYKSTIALNSGKWYFRAKFDSIANSAAVVGLHNNTSPFFVLSYLGRNDSNGWGFKNNGYYNGSNMVAWSFSSFVANDYIDVAFDIDAGKIWIGKNGTWQASGNPDAGTNAYFTNLTGALPIHVCVSAYLDTLTMDFTTIAPANATTFKTLCTANLTSVAVTTSGTFTGNANADGPFVWTNGNPATLTINGNAVTFGTHADKAAGGFKLRSSSASYNTSGSNTWTATAGKRFVYSATSINTAQGNP